MYYAAYVILGLAMSVIGPTLPELSAQTGSTLGQISTVFAASSLGVVAGSLLGGWLYDRRQGHSVFAVALLGLAALLFLIPLAATLWMLVAVVFLIGVGVGVVDVGGNVLIVWLFGKGVDPYMNAMHLFFGVGALAAPLLVLWVTAATGGIRWVYWILAGLAVPVLLWAMRIPSPERSAEEAAADIAPLRRYGLVIAMLAGLFFLHTGTELGFGGWIFTYAVAMNIGPDAVGRLLNSAYWGGFTVGRVISIPLALKLKPKTMLLIDLIGAVASVGVILLLPGWPPAVWIGTIGLGLSIASMFPSSLNYAERLMPISGRVTSLLLVGANAGSMVLPWVIGQRFESAGPQSMMVTFFIVLTAALLLLLAIRRYGRRFEGQPDVKGKLSE